MDAPDAEIVVYGRPQCGDCDAAKDVFNEEGVIFNYRDVKADPEARGEMVAVCEGLRRDPAVPVVVISHVGEDQAVLKHEVFIEPRGLALDSMRSAIRPFGTPGNPES